MAGECSGGIVATITHRALVGFALIVGLHVDFQMVAP